MQLDEVQQLSVDDGELLSDELLEEEDVPILVDVVEPVDVGAQGSADLPAVGLAESFKAVGIGMQVLELTDVDEVLGLDQSAEELEVGCCVGLGGVEVELFLFGCVVQVAAKDQSSEFVIL